MAVSESNGTQTVSPIDHTFPIPIENWSILVSSSSSDGKCGICGENYSSPKQFEKGKDKMYLIIRTTIVTAEMWSATKVAHCIAA